MLTVCHTDDIHIFDWMALMMAVVAACLQPENAAMWLLLLLMLASALWRDSRCIPLLVVMLSPAIFYSRSWKSVTAAQIVACAAYGFFMAEVECKAIKRPAPPPPPPPQPATPNPIAVMPVDVDDV